MQPCREHPCTSEHGMGGLPWPVEWNPRKLIAVLALIATCLVSIYALLPPGFGHTLWEAVENNLHKPYGPLLIFGVYMVSTVFMLPLFGLHLIAGYEYGTLVGTGIVLTAEVIAGCIVFLVTRHFIRPYVREMLNKRMGGAFKSFDEALSSGALKMVLLIRLSPVMPATLTNYAAGCTSIDVWRFAIGTAAGMFPGTCAYVNLGSLGRSAKEGHVSPATIPLYIIGAAATVYVAVEISKIARKAMDKKSQNDHTYVV